MRTCKGPPLILCPIRGIDLLTEAMMQTDSTSSEPHNLTASDRLEGTPVQGGRIAQGGLSAEALGEAGAALEDRREGDRHWQVARPRAER